MLTKIKRTGKSGDLLIPHALLFPGSGSGTYPEGAPCPGHAQLPAGVRRADLVSDGKGGWVKRGGGQSA
jgi:hypothetical protein